MYRNYLEKLAKAYKKELKWKIKEVMGENLMVIGKICIEDWAWNIEKLLEFWNCCSNVLTDEEFDEVQRIKELNA